MTESPPSLPKKSSKEVLRPQPFMTLPSPKLHAQDAKLSPGLSRQRFTLQEAEVKSSGRLALQETEVRPARSKSPLPSPAKISPQKEYLRADSPRPASRGHDGRSLLGKGHPKPRPQSLYVENDLEFLRSYDGKYPAPLEK